MTTITLGTSTVDLDALNAGTITPDQVAALERVYFTWRIADWRGADQPTGPTESMRADYRLVAGNPQRYTSHVARWLTWLRQHPESLPGAVPQGDSVTPPVMPIGPEHPGWITWWNELWEKADGRYVNEYNTLARAMGGPIRDGYDDDDEEEEEEEHEYAITVHIEAFDVTVNVTATGSLDTYEAGDYIDQADVDEAIRQYIRDSNVGWDITDVEQND